MNDENVLENLPKMKLASLETLHMKSFGADDSLDEWISQSFPSLKHLSLQQIINWADKQYFTIQSSSLEDLEILGCSCFKLVRLITENLRTLDCFIDFDDVPEHETKFILENRAPNLQSLTWVGAADPISYRLHHDEETFQDLQVTTMRRSFIIKESNVNLLIQLFKAIPLARELHIDIEVLKHCLRILRIPMLEVSS
ncbi:hypothetical protein K1719_019632 [Acacia pycnantha]|nr:hypothetical protein K1719_019632 [Acacia pycnantha]